MGKTRVEALALQLERFPLPSRNFLLSHLSLEQELCKFRLFLKYKMEPTFSLLITLRPRVLEPRTAVAFCATQLAATDLKLVDL